MFLYLLLLFTLLPFVELMLLLWLADNIGWLKTLLIVIVTGVLGASLSRWQGLRAYRRIRQETAAGRVPGDALVDGMLILVAGAVLLTPGIITDAIGFALLIPPVRSLLKRATRRSFEHRVHVETYRFSSDPEGPNGSPPRDRVIDVEVTNTRVVDEDRQQ